MKDYRYYRKITLLGDNSKYLFIKNYLNDNVKINMTLDELEKYTINIKYDEKNYIQKYDDEKIILILSNKVPMTKLISIPKDLFEIYKGDKKIEKILIFSSFPYEKPSTSNHIDYILKYLEVNDLSVVLYKKKRKVLKNQLLNQESAFKLAKKIYSKKNIDILVFDEEKNNKDLFNIDINLMSSFKQSYKNKYLILLNKFLERYDSEYDVFIKSYFQMFSLLDIDKYQKFNKLFSYEKNKNSNDIWLSFIKSFENEYLTGKDSIVNALVSFSKKFIENISFWNLETDEKVLEKCIVNEYRLFFTNHKVLKTPKNELEYIRLLNESQENSLEVIFKNKLDIFIDEKLRDSMKCFIQKYFYSMKIGEDVI